MKLIIPILIVIIVFSVVFSTNFQVNTFLEMIEKEDKLIQVDWQETLEKFNKFAEDTKNTFDSWKGEYTVDGEWQWYDYIANFFVGFWNGFTDLLTTITQFGTTIVLGLYYCGVSLIDLVNYILIGFKYLVGIKI